MNGTKNLTFSVNNIHEINVGEFRPSSFDKSATRDEVIAGIREAESKHFTENSCVYLINGDIIIKMRGEAYAVTGYFKN